MNSGQLPKYIWNHEPIISAMPIEQLRYNLFEEEKNITENALYKLENDKYLAIQYIGLKGFPDFGSTELVEFDNVIEACEFYERYYLND